MVVLMTDILAACSGSSGDGIFDSLTGRRQERQ